MSLFNELTRRNVIRVAMAYVVADWLIIQVVETILPAFGYGDAAIRYIVIILAIAFVPSLVFSWAFEITPDGLKREVNVVREHSITRFTGKKLDRIIMLLLALALSYFAFDKFVLDPVEDVQIAESAHQEGRSEALTESHGDKSIAVLPFVNMSSDAEQEYFSDGISEELLNLLSQIPEMRVISRSSSFSFKGKNIGIPTIASQLNVAHILEGSVRKAGNQVRITAQLIEVSSDTHLWSETYDRELKDIFAVQDEISAAIVAALRGRLGLEMPAQTLIQDSFTESNPRVIAVANTEAHDAYLRGRHLVVQRNRAAIEGAVRQFEKAIELDPDYALAHAELAMAIFLLRETGYGELTATEASARATPHATTATNLDPNLAEAHAATGFIAWGHSEYEEALTAFEQAIQLNPNYSIVHTWMAAVLTRVGRYGESFFALEISLQRDPLSKVALDNYVTALIHRNRQRDAESVLENFASIYPDWYAQLRGELTAANGIWSNWPLGSLDALKIEPESAALNMLPFLFAVIGMEQEALALTDFVQPETLSALGKTDQAVAIAEARFAEAPNSWFASELALTLAAAGDINRARSMLEDLWRKRGGQVVQYGLFEAGHAVALIALRRASGEKTGIEELLAAIKDNVRRYHEYGLIGTSLLFSANYEEGLAVYLSGERRRGLALIAKAAERGYFILPNEAYLQVLYDDPGFAPIMAVQKARQARERSRFLAIVCNDNPYEEVWQPAEGTCERFATEIDN